MGRGRAKAKQTKVARQLKYHTPPTDLSALERELSGKSKTDDESDLYSRYLDEEDEEEDDWAPRSR